MNTLEYLNYQLSTIEKDENFTRPKVIPLLKVAIDQHSQRVTESDDTNERINSWLELERKISEIFLVYERQVKLDKDNKEYYLKLFYKMMEQNNIDGHDVISLIRLLKIYPVKEAAFVMHFYNLAYLDYNISDWLKHSPSRQRNQGI